LGSVGTSKRWNPASEQSCDEWRSPTTFRLLPHSIVFFLGNGLMVAIAAWCFYCHGAGMHQSHPILGGS
jgi:hypothetical protein